MIVFAHRGASWNAPENTLEAFELAVDQGADFVEFDVRIGADGTLVIHHDAIPSDPRRDCRPWTRRSRRCAGALASPWTSRRRKPCRTSPRSSSPGSGRGRRSSLNPHSRPLAGSARAPRLPLRPASRAPARPDRGDELLGRDVQRQVRPTQAACPLPVPRPRDDGLDRQRSRAHGGSPGSAWTGSSPTVPRSCGRCWARRPLARPGQSRGWSR